MVPRSNAVDMYRNTGGRKLTGPYGRPSNGRDFGSVIVRYVGSDVRRRKAVDYVPAKPPIE